MAKVGVLSGLPEQHRALLETLYHDFRLIPSRELQEKSEPSAVLSELALPLKNNIADAILVLQAIENWRCKNDARTLLSQEGGSFAVRQAQRLGENLLDSALSLR